MVLCNLVIGFHATSQHKRNPKSGEDREGVEKGERRGGTGEGSPPLPVGCRCRQQPTGSRKWGWRPGGANAVVPLELPGERSGGRREHFPP